MFCCAADEGGAKELAHLSARPHSDGSIDSLRRGRAKAFLVWRARPRLRAVTHRKAESFQKSCQHRSAPQRGSVATRRTLGSTLSASAAAHVKRLLVVDWRSCTA